MSQMIVTEVQTTFSPEELQEVSGLPAEIFNEIKDLGALDEFLDHGRYVSRSFLVIRKAARLRRTFDLQSDALALLIHYMARSRCAQGSNQTLPAWEHQSLLVREIAESSYVWTFLLVGLYGKGKNKHGFIFKTSIYLRSDRGGRLLRHIGNLSSRVLAESD